MKIKTSIFLSVLFTAFCANTQIINFPDQNFKNILINNLSINTNNDNEITVQEAAVFSGGLSVSGNSIVNLSGVEYFTALTSFNCSSNCIANLNFSQNTNLVKLDCSFQELCGPINPPPNFALDFSNNSNLTYLDCGGNHITSINLSNNILLDTLELGQISELNDINLNNLINLKKLRIGGGTPNTNNLQSIDISNSPFLENFYLSYLGNFDTIDLTNNTRLKWVNFSYTGVANILGLNELDSLNIFTCIQCETNGFLDFSNNVNLEYIQIGGTQLENISLKNGNNQNLVSVNIGGSPNLTCIEVDDVNYSNANWSNSVEQTIQFNEYCMPLPRTICIVGFDSLTGNNQVVWEPDYPSNIDSIFIYRQSSTANFQKIGSVSSNAFSTFIDPTALPSVQPYKYKLSALDSVGIETPLTDGHKTIHLTISQGIGNSWNLIWNLYEGLVFDNYKLFRGSNPNDIQEIAQISSNFNSYTDYTAQTGPVYYQIGFENSVACVPLKSGNYDGARSNIVFNGVVSHDENSSEFSVFISDSKELIINCDNFENSMVSIAHSSGQVVIDNYLLSASSTVIPLLNYNEGVYIVKINGRAIKIIK